MFLQRTPVNQHAKKLRLRYGWDKMVKTLPAFLNTEVGTAMQVDLRSPWVTFTLMIGSNKLLRPSPCDAVRKDVHKMNSKGKENSCLMRPRSFQANSTSQTRHPSNVFFCFYDRHRPFFKSRFQHQSIKIQTFSMNIQQCVRSRSFSASSSRPLLHENLVLSW